MSPKKAILIIIIILVIIGGGVFSAFYLIEKKKNVAPAGENIQTAAEAATSSQAAREQLIEKKVEEKRKVIEIEAKDRAYTSEEINFILSPNKTIEKEMGPVTTTAATSATGTQNNLLTPTEIDDILNPKK